MTCDSCHRTFSGSDAFDRHQSGRHPNRVCRSETQMRRAGLHLYRGMWSRVYRQPHLRVPKQLGGTHREAVRGVSRG